MSGTFRFTFDADYDQDKSMTKERWFWQNDDKLTGKEDLDTIISKVNNSLKKLEDEYIK